MNMIVVANWKLEKTYRESIEWALLYAEDISHCSFTQDITFVLCPAFTELSAMSHLLGGLTIKLGAQDCSAYEHGPYTGEVSALSLKEIGCSYAIIGHSEHKALCHETSKTLSAKAQNLIKNGIIPIIVVGDTHEEHTAKKTAESLQNQLKPILKSLPEKPFLIAYEPLWAIGASAIPTNRDLKIALESIRTCLAEFNRTSLVLYGGGVDPETIASLRNIKGIDGFLVGRASTEKATLLSLFKALKRG